MQTLKLCCRMTLHCALETFIFLSLFCVVLCSSKSLSCLLHLFCTNESLTQHHVFFQNFRTKCTNIKKACVVTDGEASIVKAVMPESEWKLATCWNHIIRDVEFWLKKHAACSEDISVYKNQIRELLSCDTEILLR